MEKEIKIQRVSFGITIDDVRYPVNKPNLKMLKDFTAKQKDLEKNGSDIDVIDSSVDFLNGLGLPKDVVENLDPQMIEEVTNVVTGQKKS